MARLSRRAVNNIVIFAMLIMIVLFNFDTFIPKPSQPQAEVTLLPEDVHVLKMVFPTYSIERVSDTFVFKGRQSESASPFEQIQAWYSLPVEPINAPNDIQGTVPQIVTVWVAGSTSGYVFAFYALGQDRVMINYQQQWFALNDNAAKQLLGEEESR